MCVCECVCVWGGGDVSKSVCLCVPAFVCIHALVYVFMGMQATY